MISQYDMGPWDNGSHDFWNTYRIKKDITRNQIKIQNILRHAVGTVACRVYLQATALQPPGSHPGSRSRSSGLWLRAGGWSLQPHPRGFFSGGIRGDDCCSPRGSHPHFGDPYRNLCFGVSKTHGELNGFDFSPRKTQCSESSNVKNTWWNEQCYTESVKNM